MDGRVRTSSLPTCAQSYHTMYSIKKKQSGVDALVSAEVGTGSQGNGATAYALPARKKSLSVDQAIAAVGDFGLAQKFQILLCALTQALAALITVHVVFSSMFLSSDARLRLRCVDPALSSEESHKACEDVLSFSSESKPGSHSMGSVREGLCALSREAWTFSSHGSLVSDFNLLCGREWMLYLATTMYFVGVAAGTLAFALLADRNQRRSILNLGRVVAGVSCLLIATSPMIWIVFVFRFFLGMGISLMTMAAYVLSYDVTGAGWHPYVALLMQFGWSAGGATGAFLVWLMPHWRIRGFVIGLLPILMTITTWKYLIESPRWLLFQGRKGEATSAVASLALGNRTRPPDSPLADPVNLLSNPRRKLADIIKNGRLFQRTMALGFVWITVMTTAYSVLASYDAIGWLYGEGNSGNVNSSGVELAFSGFLYEMAGVAAAALAIDRGGVSRARTAAAFTGLTSLLMFIGAFSLLGDGKSHFHALRWCTVASRFGIAGSQSTVLILSWEAFPSIVVYSATWMLHTMASVLSASAPWLAFSAFLLRSAFVPWIIMASVCGGACVVLVLLDGSTKRRFLTIQEEDDEEEEEAMRDGETTLQILTV